MSPDRRPPTPEGPLDTRRAPYLGTIHAAFDRSGVPMPLLIGEDRDRDYASVFNDLPPAIGEVILADKNRYIIRGLHPVAKVVLDFLGEGWERTRFYERGRDSKMSEETRAQVERKFSPEAIERDFARRIRPIAKLLREELDLPAPPPIPGIGEGGITIEQVQESLDCDPEYTKLAAESPKIVAGIDKSVLMALNITDEQAKEFVGAHDMLLDRDTSSNIDELSPEDLRVLVAQGFEELRFYVLDRPMPDDMSLHTDATAELHPSLQQVKAVIKTAIADFYHP